MFQMVRCKVCGFVIQEKKLGVTCPVCGVPKSAFEIYTDPISIKRRSILNMHLHPITVHFPQAFSSIIPLLIFAEILLPSSWRAQCIATVEIVLMLFPFMVFSAFITGVIDAKVRFKKFRSRYLRRKIITGSALLVLSTLLSIVIVLYPMPGPADIVIIVLSILCVVCNILLGITGGKLMDSIIPGK